MTRVICINASGASMLQLGAQYTITGEIPTCPNCGIEAKYNVYLAEIEPRYSIFAKCKVCNCFVGTRINLASFRRDRFIELPKPDTKELEEIKRLYRPSPRLVEPATVLELIKEGRI